jgi:hypothetical protein
MSGHWSQSYVAFLRSVVPEIAATPLYILKVDESAIEWNNAWMASFSALGDLKAQSTIENLGLWQGRGICIRVRDDFESWSNRCRLGTLLHELGHGLEFLIQDDALCPMADLSPVAREVLTGNESELLAEVGICRNALIRGQHGADFVRLGFHLYWRARKQVVLCPNDLQFLHSIYSLSPERYEDAVEALAYELARSVNLNLRMLKAAPAAFLRLFT